MSFLSSILSTIGDPAEAPSPSAARAQSSASSQAKTSAAKPTSANGGTVRQASKRKAEGDSSGLPAKAARKDDPPKASERPNGSIRPPPPPPPSRTQSSTASNPPTYRGTAKEGGTTASIPKPTPKPLTVGLKPSNAAPPVAKPTTPITTPTSASAPKRGSYQEILARAKAQQAQQSQVGVIKHRKVENVPKKDRLAQQAEAKNKSASSKDSGKARTVDEPGPKSSDASKEKKKSTDPGHHGKMRPSAPELSYKGTMRSGVPAKSRSSNDRGRTYESSYRGTAASGGSKEKSRTGGYASYSDEEEEEEDYQSDASSDMEAAMFDVEEEEVFSLRAARKEDAEALREEEELKRGKEQRKKMLAKMAAENAKKRRF